MTQDPQEKLSIPALAAIFLAAIAVISPTFFLGQASGHDFVFHLSSWMDVAQQWHHGVAVPRWANGANYGFGEPRFILYPPISWCLGAALGLILPWKMVPDAFILIALVVAGASMHRLARSWMSQNGATVAAVIYVANPYHLVDIYLRSAFAELMASAIFPLAILCAYNCAREIRESGSKAAAIRWRNIAFLALVYAAIWYTNPPAAVVASYALAMMLAVCALLRLSFAPLVTGGAGLALGLVLAASYILPAIVEQKWVNIAQAISPGLEYAEAFVFLRLLDFKNNSFNILISAIAALEIAGAFVAAFILRKRAGTTNAMWMLLFALAATSVAMMIPGTGSTLQYLPKMRFVQFPWRWLFPLGVSLAFFLGNAFALSRRRVATAILFGAILIAAGVGIGAYGDWDSEDFPDTLKAFQTGAGYEGYDEYGPPQGDMQNISRNAPKVGLAPHDTHEVTTVPVRPVAGTVTVDSWEPEHKLFTVDAPQSVEAAVRLLNYPAWLVRVNGKPVEAEPDWDTGQMLLPLPGGKSHVEIQFGRTRDRTAGLALSGAGVVFLAGMTLFVWRRSAATAK